MPLRKRAPESEDAQELPLRELREKRRRTSSPGEEQELVDILSHAEEPIAKRGLRSKRQADMPIRLNNAASPELAEIKKAQSTKRSHIKFGDETPPPVPSQSGVVNFEIEDDEEDKDSDDEAPEAISHSHAEAETKAAAAEDARLLKQRAKDQREKRRKRAEQLSDQVKKSEKRQKQLEDNEGSSKKRDLDLDNLPNLLPEELLATEPPQQVLSDEAPVRPQKKLHGKAKGGRRAEKPPQDVVHNGTKIRVLPASNIALPPKGNKQTKNIREQWMKGRASMQTTAGRGSSLAQVTRRAAPAAFA